MMPSLGDQELIIANHALRLLPLNKISETLDYPRNFPSFVRNHFQNYRYLFRLIVRPIEVYHFEVELHILVSNSIVSLPVSISDTRMGLV